MKRPFLALVLLFITSLVTYSQKDQTPAAAQVAADNQTALKLAKAALDAHGGDKFKQMKAFILKGTVDINVSNQVMPGTFSTAVSGEKYYFEISGPVQSVKQICDGEVTYSTLPANFRVPPPTAIGFEVLARVGDTGYLVTVPGDPKKKGKGFRITTPDGFYTDFTVDEKTGQVSGFQSAFILPNNQTVTTAAEMGSYAAVDGVLLPKKYSQRFDFGGLMAYATFQIKDAKVNPDIDASAFAIPK